MPKVSEKHRKLAHVWAVDACRDGLNEERLAMVLAEFESKMRLEEAQWWAASIDPYSPHAPSCAARITELKKEVGP